MICPNCQTSNVATAVECRNCGAPLPGAPTVEGERKFATVLFADVVGSTGLAEQLDPEDWAEIMNGEFAVMNAAVGRFGGTVARLMGDAILAFFGAPRVHEDDAERAVRAALEIRDETRRYAASVRARYGIEFDVRVGVNTGLAILGVMGDRWRNEYTAMGDTTNVASRLQSEARPGTILISSDTYHLVQNLFEFDCRGYISVKGRSAEVEVYEVLEAKASGTKLRGLEGITSPLVGRESELTKLRDRIAGLDGGTGAVAAVVGEAGLGKSRLIAELRSSFRARNPRGRWVEGSAISYGQSISYFPWQQLLMRVIGAHEGDTPASIRQRLQDEVERLQLRVELLPFLETVLAVESATSTASLRELDGDFLVRQVTDACRSVLRAIAATGPTVVVFDDIHWADPASVDLLRETAELVKETPILLLLLLRPDKSAPSWVLLGSLEAALAERFAELRLEPLDPGHSRELLGNLLFIENLPDSTRALILRKSEGNPFFLEEVIRALIDDELIVNEGGRWRAKSEIEDVAIPDTLIGVLSARIDKLPQETKRVAQTAAVIGRTFAHRVLKEVCDSAPAAERVANVEPHIGTLTYEELVREGIRLPELEYNFKHALTCEAAYDLLLLKRRREIHRRTAAALERLYAERLDDRAAVLAHHLLQGQDWSGAASYAKRAGERAMKIYALEDARDHFDAAIRALEQLPDTSPDLLIDSILRWYDPAERLRMHEDVTKRDAMLTRLMHAVDLARSSRDLPRLARSLMAVSNVYMLSGFPTRAVPLVTEAYEIATRIGDDSLVLLPFFLATDSMIGRDPKEAAAQFAEVVEMARQQKNLGILAHALAGKAAAHSRLGEFAEAEAALAEALEVAPRSGSAIKWADVEIAAAGVYYDMGQLEKGLEFAKRGADRAFSVKGLECACAGYYFTGAGHLYSENLAAAMEAFQRSKRLSEEAQMGTHYFDYLLHGGLALVRLARGHPEALGDLEKALGNAKQAHDEYAEGLLSHSVGESRLGLGEPARAIEPLLGALNYYRRNAMKPYIARALAPLAEAYRATGRIGEADAAQAESEALVAELHLPPEPPRRVADSATSRVIPPPSAA